MNKLPSLIHQANIQIFWHGEIDINYLEKVDGGYMTKHLDRIRDYTFPSKFIKIALARPEFHSDSDYILYLRFAILNYLLAVNSVEVIFNP